MAKIKVKKIQTGEIGTLSEEFFNPQVYERLDQGMRVDNAVQNPPQKKKGFQVTDLLPVAGGIIGGIGGSIVAPGAGTIAGGAAGAGAGEFIRQKLTPEKDDDALAIAREAALGGIAGPVGKVIGKGAGLLTKGAGKIAGKEITSKSLKSGAEALEEGVRKIRVKSSISGAQTEKDINNTLNRLGFKGSAQKQYESLQPAMNKLEREIQQIIKLNPKVTVAKEDIKKSFLNKLKTSLRSKDLTQKQATTEVEGYLNDLIKASGGTGKFTNINLERLRHLKKLVNEDYGPVHDILARGGSLTARQKVIDVAWSSLDDAVKNASPAMKKILLDESNLYKAAAPLSAARTNVPTFRFFGTSIPAGITQRIKDVGAGTLRTTGNITGNEVVKQGTIQLAGQPAVRAIGSLGQGTTKEEISEIMPENHQIDQFGNLIPQSKLMQSEETKIPSNNIISQNQPQMQTKTDSQGQQYQEDQNGQIYSMDNKWMWDENANDWVENTQNQEYGALDSDSIYNQMVQSAQETGKIPSSLTTLYKIAIEREKNGSNTTFTAGQLKEMSDIQNSINIMDSLIPVLEEKSGLFGPIKGQLGNVPYATESKALESQFRAAAQMVGKAMEGGVLRKEDEIKYRKMLPQLTDTAEVAMRKIENVRQMVLMQLQTKERLYTNFETKGLDITSAIQAQ